MLEARGKSSEFGLTAVCMSGELAAGESGRVGSALAPVGVVSGVWKAGEGGAGAGLIGVLAGVAGAAACCGGAGSKSSSSSSSKESRLVWGMENRNGSSNLRVGGGDESGRMEVSFASKRAGRRVPSLQLFI